MKDLSQLVKRLSDHYLKEVERHSLVVEACHSNGQQAPISEQALDHATYAVLALAKAPHEYRTTAEWALAQTNPQAAHARVMAKLPQLLTAWDAANDAIDAHPKWTTAWHTTWDALDEAGDKALKAVLACVLLVDAVEASR